MTSSDDIFEGAKWFRAALQVNPFGYVGRPAPSDKYPDEAQYNSALLDQCEILGISILAVTDHWKAATAAGLVADAATRGIVVLPGFEANCREGFHLLVIFEAGTEIDLITEAIGACGAPSDDPHGPGDRYFADIAEEMARKGALVIPAHVNVATSGLLARAAGKPLENIVRSDDILALGTTPSQPIMGDQEAILANKKPYLRPHPLVEIFADDVSHPSALALEGSTTWFKMAKPSLRGLQHALRTPQTRVRLHEPEPMRGTRLRRISWIGGFLDGLDIPLGPELTALIGGRGTGKSTVIESIRFVIDQPPTGEDALRDHKNVVQKVLGAGAIVRLEVEKRNPEPEKYVIQRTVGDPPLVLDASGTKTQQLPADIVGEIEAFGQHELAELAHDKNLLASLVRRLGGDFEDEHRRPPLVAKLAKNRSDLGDLETQQGVLEGDLAAIPRLEEQAKKFDETGLGVKLEAHREISDERAVLDEFERRITAAALQISDFGHSSIVEELKLKLPMSTESPRRQHLEAAEKSGEALGEAINAAFLSITAAIDVARADLAASKQIWQVEIQPELEAHAETRRVLTDQGYEPDTYLKTTSALKALSLRAEERVALHGRHKELSADRQRLLGELAVLDGKIASELHKAISATNGETKNKVNVRPVPNPERGSLKKIVERYFKTPRTQIMAAIDTDNFSVPSFVVAVRGGVSTLLKYGITGAQATNLIGHGEPLLREIEEQAVGLAVDIYLNVAAEGVEFRKLDDLSKGQRATALLLLLLGISRTPLIIDQPEDDLDNRFVYRGVVQHLRDLKGSRQIIVSTHNANVPVLGDAELVVVLESDGRRGAIAKDGIGSLDEAPIRDFAERLLEGGPEAFRARRHLYGF